MKHILQEGGIDTNGINAQCSMPKISMLFFYPFGSYLPSVLWLGVET